MRAGDAAGVGTDTLTMAWVPWSTAWRLALALSASLAVLGAALYHFLGIERPVLVLLAGLVALSVGMRLPAVERPNRVRVP